MRLLGPFVPSVACISTRNRSIQAAPFDFGAARLRSG